MAVVNFTGFETGDALEFLSTNGTFSVQTGTVRTGTYAGRTNPSTTGAGSFNLSGIVTTTGRPAAGAATIVTSYVRFYFRYATKPAANSEQMFRALNTTSVDKFSVRINSSGNLLVYDQANALVSTGSTVLSANTWYRIEIKIGTGASAAYEVKIDGTSELSGTCDQTIYNTSRVQFGKIANQNGQTVDFFYDDILWSDSAYPGLGECKLGVPNANGNYQTWTRSDIMAAHYEHVDERPYNTTDYMISTQGSGDAETNAMQSAATIGVTGTINAVKSFAMVASDSITSTGSLKFRMRSGSTDTTTSTGFTTSISAYEALALVHSTDPATSAAWTTGGVDGVEVGAVENSISQKSRMTASYIMVDYDPTVVSTYLPPPVKARQAVNRSATY